MRAGGHNTTANHSALGSPGNTRGTRQSRRQCDTSVPALCGPSSAYLGGAVDGLLLHLLAHCTRGRKQVVSVSHKRFAHMAGQCGRTVRILDDGLALRHVCRRAETRPGVATSSLLDGGRTNDASGMCSRHAPITGVSKSVSLCARWFALCKAASALAAAPAATADTSSALRLAAASMRRFSLAAAPGETCGPVLAGGAWATGTLLGVCSLA